MCHYCGKKDVPSPLCAECAEFVRRQVAATDAYLNAGGLGLWSADMANHNRLRGLLAEYDERK